MVTNWALRTNSKERPKKILYIGAQESYGSAIIAELGKNNYDVISTDDVDEALDILKKNKYDLILSKNRMPPGSLGKDQAHDGEDTGAALASSLRRQGNNTPILIYDSGEYLSERSHAILEPLRLVKVLHEGLFFPAEIVEEVSEFIKKSQGLAYA